MYATMILRFTVLLAGVLFTGPAQAASRYQSCLCRDCQLKAALRTAQAEFDIRADANRRVPGTVSIYELRLLELHRDRAQIDVERFAAARCCRTEAVKVLDRRRTAVSIELAEVEVEQNIITSAQSHEHDLELNRRRAALEAELKRLRAK